jgi:hypothetical protein
MTRLQAFALDLLTIVAVAMAAITCIAFSRLVDRLIG